MASARDLLEEQDYRDLKSHYKFKDDLVQLYGTPDVATANLNALDTNGRCYVAMPTKNHAAWTSFFSQAVEHGIHILYITQFNPHYKYWFRHVWPVAARVDVVQTPKIKLAQYKLPCPKPMAFVVYDPAQRRTKRTNLMHTYNAEADKFGRLYTFIRILNSNNSVNKPATSG